MKAPTVHLNGTGRDALMEQQADVCNALAVALKVMAHAVPNARDFYVQGPDAFGVAMEEHRSRVLAVERVRAEHVAIHEAIAGGTGGT